MIARIADAHKTENLAVLKVEGLVNFTDYFVIGTGHTRNHLQAIGHAVQRALRKEGERCLSAVGYRDTEWVVLDYATVIAHLFSPVSRDYYSLDRLWGDAEPIDWEA
jgi:ribosome-associated protein